MRLGWEIGTSLSGSILTNKATDEPVRFRRNTREGVWLNKEREVMEMKSAIISMFAPDLWQFMRTISGVRLPVICYHSVKEAQEAALTWISHDRELW